MSVSNLIVPNNYELYCKTINPSQGIITNTYTDIVSVSFENVGEGQVAYSVLDGGIFEAVYKRDHEFVNISGRFRILVNNGNEQDLRINMHFPYPIDTTYNRINYINASGNAYQETLNNEGFIGELKSDLSTQTINGLDVIKIRYNKIFPTTNTYNFNQTYTLHYNINCRLYTA